MRKLWIILGGLLLGTGCVTARPDPLPSVEKLDCWKDRFNGWSKGVESPVTVIVLAAAGDGEAGGTFRAYGVDPDRGRILFLLDGNAREHLAGFIGDPLWGTVVNLDARALARAEKEPRPEAPPGAYVQRAVDLVRRFHAAPRVAEAK